MPDVDSSAPEDIQWGAISVRTVSTQDRRLEGETYLEDGYGLQLAIRGRATGWAPLGTEANVWQPSRLKGVTVGPGSGIPFFSAGQMFEERPVARKWLVPELTPDIERRKISRGQLLLSCSGVVGNAMASTSSHENAVVTHDLLRVDLVEPERAGWAYGYMRSDLFKTMAVSARYGHMIKHLEPEHVRALPFISPTETQQARTKDLFDCMQEARQASLELTDRAHNLLSAQLDIQQVGSRIHSSVSFAQIARGRRRLDAEHFRPGILEIEDAFERSAQRVDDLSSVTARVWWPNRFKRTLARFGTPYVSASEVFDRVLNPTKYIYASQVPNAADYSVEAGWILMARSGQVYGLNGRVKLATKRMEKVFVSEDLIRISADPARINNFYLLAVLSHPQIGRPAVIRNAYGTSIPHLEPRDILDVSIPRFRSDIEGEVAELMAKATEAAEQAEQTELELVSYVSTASDLFLKDESSGT